MPNPRPHDNCYWLVPDLVLAGEYPGDLSREGMRQRLLAIAAAGVRVFIDLTQEIDGLAPYAHMLPAIGETLGATITHEPFGLPDMSVPPSPARTRQILARLDTHHTAGTPVYLHCWGGIGRTGLIAACWLVQQGHEGQAALDIIAGHWQTVAKRDRYPQSPQTRAQHQYVRDWARQRAES